MIGDARNNQWSIEGLKTGDTWMTRDVCSLFACFGHGSNSGGQEKVAWNATEL